MQPACGEKSPEPPPAEDGWLPGGQRMATVQKLTDGCGLLLPELMEGRSVQLLLQREGDTVTVSAPGTTLPRLRADMHQRDRFKTETRVVPITAKGGACQGRRTQYYEGRDNTPTEYHVIFHSDEDMPTGECTGVPLPCRVAAVLAIRWCPPRMDCIFPR